MYFIKPNIWKVVPLYSLTLFFIIIVFALTPPPTPPPHTTFLSFKTEKKFLLVMFIYDYIVLFCVTEKKLSNC